MALIDKAYQLYTHTNLDWDWSLQTSPHAATTLIYNHPSHRVQVTITTSKRLPVQNTRPCTCKLYLDR